MTLEPKRTETDTITGLAKWPYRNRRKLEKQWLEVLDRRGVEVFVEKRLADPPSELITAIDQFNRGEFWECHETLEDVWRETPYPFRLFYHAIIKTAVGFHHLSVHNRNGARVKLTDGVSLLKIFQPEWLGVQTNLLLADISEWLSVTEPENIHWTEFDSRPRPQILTTADQDTPA